MQEQTFDGQYTEPKPVTQKGVREALKRVFDGSTKRLLIFAAKDAHGRPTKEMRRAWRRSQKKRGKNGCGD
jgi:hypothetical protein